MKVQGITLKETHGKADTQNKEHHKVENKGK